ncbi:metallophosphoesterase [Paenibacillus albus]|uniref:Calcineurin-like phosphoesterase domain-containing protein n=1 Tax=Paenibacillus albus TaxID=2495582 RepID=A0A3S9A5P4_9BACL|nr:metallophosphoesterase [Paenibacillus albus]AZN41035.1 hypothetical protein EJC50_16195 [Paenibacillus albus]
MTIFITITILAFAFIVSIVYQTLWVKCSYHRIGLGKSKSSLKVVQLSDLHGRIRFINGSLSSLVNRINPDCVMITGDLASKKGQLEGVLNEIARINCPNLYFVPGNYEREGLDGFQKRVYSASEYNFIIQSLQGLNVAVLENSGSTIEWNGKKCLVYGFDNSIYGNERLTWSKEDMASADCVIMLAHSPSILTFIENKQLTYDLLLAGHTHGGQIRLLNKTIGAYKGCHVGLKQTNKRSHFYINRGLGTVKIPLRVACFPEIAVFEIGICT